MPCSIRSSKSLQCIRRTTIVSICGMQSVQKVGSPNGPLMSFLPAITIPGVAPVMGDIPAVGAHTDAILAELGLLENTQS